MSIAQDPVIRPLVELDTKSLESMLPEVPHWVKNPDFDRIDWLNKFVENIWPYLDKVGSYKLVQYYLSKFLFGTVL
jgi:hypothetical protein